MSWTLVYENDASGNATFGSIQTLISAIRNGAPVNVVVTEKAKSDYILAFRAHTVRVRNGVVSATNTQDVSSTYVGNEVLFLDDSYHYMLVANTTGVVDQLRWSLGEHTARGHDQLKRHMRWFVD